MWDVTFSTGVIPLRHQKATHQGIYYDFKMNLKMNAQSRTNILNKNKGN